MTKIILISIFLFFSGCDFKKVDEGNAPAKSAMKCGAGKCGASMFNDDSVLDKKKQNVLSQLEENDSRKECVNNAKDTTEVYNCVRGKDGKLTIKDAQKCGGAMKCGAGKCGAAMNKPESKKAAMKCGEGKCGAVKIDTH